MPIKAHSGFEVILFKLFMYYEKNSHYGKIEFWEKRYAE